MTVRIRARRDTTGLLESGVVVWSVVAVVLAFAVLQSSQFRTIANLENLSRQVVVLAIVALAQFVVVLAGGVDLSLATNARLSSIVGAIVMAGSDGQLLLGCLAALGTGLGIGAVNALIVVRFRVEPFITTLGTGALVGGLALYIASGPTGRAAPALTSLYGSKIGPFYYLVILAAAIWCLAWVLLGRSSWGRHLYAVGGDPGVARLSGLRVSRTTTSAYLIAGSLGGFAGILLLAGSGVGDPSAGTNLEFESLAAVVIGGASLAGGRGRAIGVLGGVVMFGVLGNVFNLLRVDVWYQQLIRGVIILVAASLFVGGAKNSTSRLRRLRRRPSTVRTADQPLLR
jgi:ribose transport system permease protein